MIIIIIHSKTGRNAISVDYTCYLMTWLQKKRRVTVSSFGRIAGHMVHSKVLQPHDFFLPDIASCTQI